MAGGDRSLPTWIDASGLRVSRNEMTQAGPAFLMLWPGCPRNESTAVFECKCGGFEVYKVRDVYRGHCTNCRHCNAVRRRPQKLLRQPPRKGQRQDRTDRVSSSRGPHREYFIWSGMIARCHNPRVAAYENYGGRGIVVCDRWRESFAAFLEDMGERPSNEHSIDRIDVNGNYEPGNCRWATNDMQNYNKRHTVRIKGKTLLDISLETGLSVGTIRSRLAAGWPYDRIVSTPVGLARG